METIVTAILFSVAGCFNGLEKSLWVMARGVLQALLVRLPLSYFLCIQPNAKLAMIGIAAPVATIFGIAFNIAGACKRKGFAGYFNWLGFTN